MRSTHLAALLVIGAGLWTACSDSSRDLLGPNAPTSDFTHVGPDLRAALAAQKRHTPALLRVPGVGGTAIGLAPNGKPTVRLLLAQANVTSLPLVLDGVPVTTEVPGMFFVRSDPTQRQRPAPLGFSLGHPAITAGSIGGRVVDAAGKIYVLSNNHVLANSNDAAIGDPALQPGPFDGGTAPADQIGTLAAFKPINFSGGTNTIDAAIALSSADNLSNATPADEGYGLPNSAIYGDANGDGVFDDRNALLGLAVQKYGRTTKATHGQITGINATVNVCYEVFIIFCVKQATFVDQLIIEPGTFSGGGDSGSLIVADDGTNRPVVLLFAGSSTQTIANRIDLVLNNFGARIDGSAPPPPPPQPAPVTDLAVTSVGAPSSATQGNTVNVSVAGKNVVNSDTCTTGELGGNGTCIVLFPSLKKSVTSVNMTVVSVTYAGRTYDRTFNHDPDGDSNGTTIKVLRPN